VAVDLIERIDGKNLPAVYKLVYRQQSHMSKTTNITLVMRLTEPIAAATTTKVTPQTGGFGGKSKKNDNIPALQKET